MSSPEELAREKIDKLLTDCGWVIQDRSTINLSAARGIAIREALLKDRDEVDYLLFIDGKAVGRMRSTLPPAVWTIRRTFRRQRMSTRKKSYRGST